MSSVVADVNVNVLGYFTDKFSFNELYNYTFGRPIWSLFQLPGEHSVLNSGLTEAALELGTITEAG